MNRKIKLVLVLASVLLLTGVNSALADDSTGTVNVTPEIARISDVIFPENVDPNVFTTLAFQLEYETGFTTSCDVWIHFFSSGITADLPTSGANPTTLGDNHLCAHWQNDGNGWDILGGTFSDFVTPAVAVTDGSPILLGLDVKFIKEVMVGDWELKILLKFMPPPPEDTQQYIWSTTTWTMNGFMEVAINFVTFDFGDIEQGQVKIGISTPACGYLNMTITSNVEYLIQVSGSDPEQGVENFGVGNILANSIDEVSSAIPLASALADLANLGSQLAGSEVIHRIYLWISIPVSAPVGTYTFVLTIAVVPA